MAEKKTFESSMTKLEDIVSKLEKAEGGLDETVKLYEQGVVLAAQCSKMLDEAEQKVTILAKGPDGIQETEFKPAES